MNWKDNVQLWKELAQQPGFGLVTDVDGTISPIVDQPDQAAILPGVRPLLEQLRDCLMVVGVISGRGVEDVRQRVGVPGLVYFGNHGFEQLYKGKVIIPEAVASYQSALAQAAEEVQQALLPGMMLEDKGVTLTIHYRQLAVDEEALPGFDKLMISLAERLGLTLSQGRKVYELRPPLKIDKGSAFASLVKDFNVQAAVYLGDDTTDAAVFEKAKRLREAGLCRCFGIGVLSANTPSEVLEKSDYSADGVEDVAEFLALMVDSARAFST